MKKLIVGLAVMIFLYVGQSSLLPLIAFRGVSGSLAFNGSFCCFFAWRESGNTGWIHSRTFTRFGDGNFFWRRYFR